MLKANENFLKLQDSYLFSTIAKKVAKFQSDNPDKKIIKLGIGDVTRPIPPSIIQAMHKAVDEMAISNSFKGYGPENGYDFLKEKIADFDYARRNVKIDLDEIFISDGAKCDCGNITDIFSIENIIAITDPVYPVYLDTNVMSGRSGNYNEKTGKYNNIIYIPTNSDNGFVPKLPSTIPDIIYLCFPNNPTGTTLTKEQLKVWVDYAKENNSLILFDSAYEAFIHDDDIPHSIYEIDGAKDVAIEFRSFSKTAGFTGLRCAYTIVPKNLKTISTTGEEIKLNSLWNRRHGTKFNGVSYPIQRAAEAIYSEEGQKEIKENISYYMENAQIIRNGLKELGFSIYGGINAPYIWLKVPNNMTSWEFFDKLLNEAYVVGTPGIGFGPNGEGYFRLTAFGSKENTLEAINRITELFK